MKRGGTKEMARTSYVKEKTKAIKNITEVNGEKQKKGKNIMGRENKRHNISGISRNNHYSNHISYG